MNPDLLEAIDQAIAAFDRKHVASLDDLAATLEPSDAVLCALIEKCSSEDEATQTAASWIVKKLWNRARG